MNKLVEELGEAIKGMWESTAFTGNADHARARGLLSRISDALEEKTAEGVVYRMAGRFGTIWLEDEDGTTYKVMHKPDWWEAHNVSVRPHPDYRSETLAGVLKQANLLPADTIDWQATNTDLRREAAKDKAALYFACRAKLDVQGMAFDDDAALEAEVRRARVHGRMHSGTDAEDTLYQTRVEAAEKRAEAAEAEVERLKARAGRNSEDGCEF